MGKAGDGQEINDAGQKRKGFGKTGHEVVSFPKTQIGASSETFRRPPMVVHG